MMVEAQATKPTKMEFCWAISSVAKATPNIMPIYLTASPVSMRRTIKFMGKHHIRCGRYRHNWR